MQRTVSSPLCATQQETPKVWDTEPGRKTETNQIILLEPAGALDLWITRREKLSLSYSIDKPDAEYLDEVF